MWAIALDAGWSCDYFEVDPDLYEFQDYRQTLPMLRDWQFDKRYPEGWAAYLERRFTLAPTEMCIRYLLLVRQVPEGAELSVNGRAFGPISAPAEIDVTDYVTLDDNRLAFRVLSGAEGRFDRVELIATPCEA